MTSPQPPKAAISQALRVLAEEGQRSETARLREVLDDVEHALNAGVSRAAVLDVLHAQGFTMSMKTFENTLYRLRKRRASSNAPPRSSHSASPAPAARQTPRKDSSEQSPAVLIDKQKIEKVADQYMNKTEANPFLKFIHKGQK
ncbi:hypothetical protein OOT46_25915 [Aquabacterium sp. A7-Y]|uniref:hypothetical protein n=1 Tax=Aquabacterium sp. A7-Y TaxID=1349605 RepID=UPI00223D5592|nr:hypothetical protein [Aquabacterium sp. A7-Y]MCW7541252.1 hypothetical protein [Aquabacterium sp. A7-Y]